jgi:hypothetical protein
MLSVDVENILAPTIGFDLEISAESPLTFMETTSTGGIAAPMTHEIVDFTFECSASGGNAVRVDFTGNLGPDGPTFGFGAPNSTFISCQ